MPGDKDGAAVNGRPTPLLVDIPTAAAMLGDVGDDTVRGLVAAGLLPRVELPSVRRPGERSRRVLIAVRDLEAFVAKHRESSTPIEVRR